MERYKKIELNEMSKPLAWIIEKIRALEPEINEHALKIMLFEQESTWKNPLQTGWLIYLSIQ